MQDIEKGCNAELLMEEVAASAASYINDSPSLIIAGTGNNGADSYLIGCHLLKRNIPCAAYTLGPSKKDSLNALQKKRFVEAGGILLDTLPADHTYSCLIDGIFGIGFSGAVSDEAQKAIKFINDQHIPVYAIDIPSGLDPTTGMADVAVHADYTLTCHLPKLGFFLNEGWKYTGELIVLPLSLPIPDKNISLLEFSDIAPHLPPIKRTRDKYSAGAVVGVAGSLEMPGASLLASEASLRMGAGIVRLFTPKDAFSVSPLKEIIRIPIEKAESWLSTFTHADAAFIGPGLGRSNEALEIFTKYLSKLPKKKVIDGDGLFFCKNHLEWLKESLITPHKGEMSTLLDQKISSLNQPLLETIRSWTVGNGCTLILKGAPTFIFSAKGECFVMPRGDPGMATAGSGDVLTGILAGLMAQKLSPLDAALVGTWLHGRAGEIAAEHLTSYSMLASDIIYALPEAIAEQIGQ